MLVRNAFITVGAIIEVCANEAFISAPNNRGNFAAITFY
jgi:hypothetical protein